MADFDFLSQLQGPNIPISLYGDATTQGIAAGNNSPTKTTSIIQGALKGIGQGQEIVANQQIIDINQNKINQQPIENQIRQQQLQNAQLSNQAKALEVAHQTQNEKLILEDETAKLKESISATTKATQDREMGLQFADAFKKASPQQQAQMVMSNQYADIFASNPQLYKQSLQTVYLDPQSGLDTATRNKIGVVLKKEGVKDSYQKAAEQALPKYLAAEASLNEDPITGQLIAETGYSANQIYNNSKFVPSGMYQLSPDGKTVLTKHGEPQINPQFDRSALTGTSDVLFRDPETGQYSIPVKNVDSEPRKKFDTWVAQKAIQDGSSMQSDIRAIDRSVEARNAPKPQADPSKLANPFARKSLGAPKQEPLRIQIARSTLQLTDESIQRIDPTLKEFESSVMKSATDAEYRGTTGAILSQNAIKETLAKNIAYAEYDTSPTLQAQYTQADVERYNAELKREASDKMLGNRGPSLTAQELDKMLAPFIITNPKDLYYTKQSPAIKTNIQFLENQYIKVANQRATALLNRQSSTQRMMLKLSGVANGSQ